MLRLLIKRSFKSQTGVGRPNAIMLVDQAVRCYLDLAPALAFEMDHLAPGDVDQQGIAAGARGLLPIGRRTESRVRRVG